MKANRHIFNLHGICSRCGVSYKAVRVGHQCRMRIIPRRGSAMGSRQGWSRIGKEIDRLRRRGLIDDACQYVIVDGHARPNTARPAGLLKGGES